MTFKSAVLKWIPTLRHVEDFPDEVEIEDVKILGAQNVSELKTDAEASVLSLDSLNKNHQDVKLIEYRDEADRPWWRFFTEYEYRINSYETQKHKWWYWFDEGTTAAEKKLLYKLDVLIAVYVFLVYWVKSLDSSN